MGVRRSPWHRLIVHQPPKKDPATRADGSMGLMGGLQLLLQFFDAGFPILSTAGQITNRYTQLPNLLLFLGGALFPQIAAGSKFSDRHGFWGRFVKSLQNTASRRFAVAFHGLGNGRRLC